MKWYALPVSKVGVASIKAISNGTHDRGLQFVYVETIQQQARHKVQVFICWLNVLPTGIQFMSGSHSHPRDLKEVQDTTCKDGISIQHTWNTRWWSLVLQATDLTW